MTLRAGGRGYCFYILAYFLFLQTLDLALTKNIVQELFWIKIVYIWKKVKAKL